MARISRTAHGIIDYVFGLLLAASPWIFGFSHQHLAPEVAITFGAGAVMYSLLTNYEVGVIRLIPFPFHLFLDLVSGFLLALVWMHFGIIGRAGVTFTLFGVLELGVVMLTRRTDPEKVPSVF